MIISARVRNNTGYRETNDRKDNENVIYLMMQFLVKIKFETLQLRVMF